MTPALTVSTTAVKLAGENAGRKSLVIANNGGGTLYVGYTSAVTSSGAAMGRAVTSFGSYSDTGDGVWVGQVWGIYSTSASSQNVAVQES